MTEDQLIAKLLQEIENSPLKENTKLVKKACLIAKKAHHGQTRKSANVPFLIHPIETASKLLNKYNDLNLTIAAILHDAVEDSDLEIKAVYQAFGEEIGFIVDAMNKYEQSFYQYPQQTFADKTERLLWAGDQDIRCLLVKVADREHNLETLGSFMEPKQRRMSFESQAIFMPLKKVLQFETPQPLTTTKKLFSQFKTVHHCPQAKETKDLLINQSFANIDSELFGTIYDKKADVTWEITSREDIKKFVKNDAFNQGIELVEVSSSLTDFKADFKFKKGVIIDDKITLKLANSKI